MSTATVDPGLRSGSELDRDVPGFLANLARHRYIVLRSFRRDGTPVDTPVWFALGDDKLYVFTEKYSGKVKRIRSRPAVQIAPSTPTGGLRGPFRDAPARILPADEQAGAQELLRARYGWMIRAFERWWAWRGREHVFLELAPLNGPTAKPAAR